MEIDANLIIWVVDEVEPELTTTVSSLKRHLRNKYSIEILPIEALSKPRKEDYLSLISDTRTAALILDQRLQTRGGVDHTGIQLAIFLREVARNLPIYIMTNYVTENGEPNDEFNGTDWSVDDILDKSILKNKKEIERFIARLMRRINVYATITEEREKRFQVLLIKSLDGELSSEEQEEFDRISFERLGALALSEQIEQKKVENTLHQLEEVLRSLDTYQRKK